MPFGYDQSLWDRAVREATGILHERAARRSNQTISYSELAALMKTIRFGPQDHPFHALLGDVSVAEDKASRGMLSVLVVHKGGDQMPGPGFFELAEELGRHVDDELKFWSDEFRVVLNAHSQR